MDKFATAQLGRLADLLDELATARQTMSYAEAVETLTLSPPHRIRQLAEMLEELMQHDASNGSALRAALIVSPRRGGIPAPGFFQQASQLGLYFGPKSGAQAETFHQLELSRLLGD